MVCVCVWVCVCVCVYVCVPGVLIIQIFMHVNIWVYTMCSLISCANILLCTQQHVNISDENLDADITDENLHPNIWVSSLSPFTIRRVFHLDFKNYLFFSKVDELTQILWRGFRSHPWEEGSIVSSGRFMAVGTYFRTGHAIMKTQ